MANIIATIIHPIKLALFNVFVIDFYLLSLASTQLPNIIPTLIAGMNAYKIDKLPNFRAIQTIAPARVPIHIPNKVKAPNFIYFYLLSTKINYKENNHCSKAHTCEKGNPTKNFFTITH